MTTWTQTNKSATTTHTFTPRTDPGVPQGNLLIGGGYRLLIGGGYFLIIQPPVAGTTWSFSSKS